jgi:hypothetical protein
MATVTFTFAGAGGIGPFFNVIMTHNGALIAGGSTIPGSGNSIDTTVITNVLGRDPNNGNAIIGPGSGWTPLFDSGTGNVRRKTDVTSSITGQALCEYITWRTENTNVHPTTGYSLDIWYDFNNSTAQNILLGISNNSPTATWYQLAQAGALPLSSNYWTVLYDYNNQYAIGWRKGGTCTVTLA